MAGIGNKDKEFWKYIKNFDFISLCETWVEEKAWEGWKDKLPQSHEWACRPAVKEKRKGRAKGGFIIGKKKEGRGQGKLLVKEKEGMVMSEIEMYRERWKIISVYEQGKGDIGKRINEFVGEGEKEKVIIGGDFNIRTGELGGDEIGEESMERHSKDKIIGNGGKKFVEWIKERGWYMLNGRKEGDWEGEYTYVGKRGNTVIDYVIVSEEINDKVNKFKIGNRVDSDHLPLEVEWKKEEGRRKGTLQKKNREEVEEIEITVWDEEAIQGYKDMTEKLSRKEAERDKEENSVEDKWETMKRIIYGSLVKRTIKKRKRELGHKDWWDRSCTKRKREVKRMFWKWRRGKVARERYIREKKSFREMLEKKQKEKREEEEMILRNLKKETEIWKYINKKRGKKVIKDEGGNKIDKEEWRSYFMDLLDGTEREQDGTQDDGEEEVRIEQERTEEDIKEEEVWSALRKMKKKKAAGIDGIPTEAWLYAGEELRGRLLDLLKLIWRKGKIPNDWKKSIVVPIYKRGDKEVPGNYRGISLLCTAYKIYAEILRKRLEKETEEKGLVPESQAGFRKGRSTIDNIFVLNHIMQREKRQGGKDMKVYMLFADLKAAFDNVDRDILWKELKRKGIEERLVRRIEMVYEDTEVVIRSRQGFTRSFRTRKGVRQGCVMSPLLFNLYMAELEEKLEKRKLGGVGIGRKRIWNLAYADDLVLLANNRDAIQDMMATFRRFLKERNLILCVEKTKMVVCNRKRGEKKQTWFWKDKSIEEVQEFKYLGFVISNKGKYREHIKELERKGKIAARKVWGIGEKMCRDDFSRRWNLFKYLVQSTMAYGVEIWGWEEKESLEKVMMDYTRWLFGLEFCTPRYMITKELSMEKLKIGWGLRARRYEERIKKGTAGSIAKECWLEKEAYGWKDGYGREREKYYNRNGWGIMAKEIRGNSGENNEEENGLDREKELINRERDTQRQYEESKIKKAKYNWVYKKIRLEGRGVWYLRKENLVKMGIGRGDEVRALVKLRCGNLEWENKYWLEEKDRRCLFCEQGKDSIDHYVRECQETKEWFVEMGKDEKERVNRIRSEILDETKGRILKKLWKGREKQIRVREKERNEEKVCEETG